ncbi:hypothetical protein Q0590_30700 [Rhodocytophaga aerolata]|uniref:Chromosome partition protein Smc n=1 Tax=Rhodocytophaga aerolata TaxID=455078 RepID=A0ABT8RHN7_9BACT|nr:hypothetical protein [Rhodocytophaga aerolata]MDO1450683.1 hypothetical protein [Rhodocytophaga aerolata]
MGALLLFSIAGNIYYWTKSQDLASEKDRIAQKSDVLLLGQSRDIKQLKKQLNNTQRENRSYTNQVNELTNSISAVNTDIWELRTKGANNRGSLDSLRNEGQAKLSDLNNKADQLMENNSTLTRKNNQLNQQADVLNDSLQRVANALTADGFRIVALKSNYKETAKAKKVAVLTVSFTVPAEFGLRGRKEVYLSLTNSQGTAVNPVLRTFTLSNAEDKRVIPVHAVKSVNFYERKESVEFTFDDTKAIRPGMYIASAYTKDKYLGSVEVQFRDSFWFF